MKLEVDKAAIEYIKEKGGVINVDLYVSSTCCAGITEPVVNFGYPEMIGQFDENIIDDVKIYVSKFIELKDNTLTLKMKRFLGIKNISVDGIKRF